MTFQEIRIIATSPCIANQLRDVNTICRRNWYIAAHIWKIYYFKFEVVPFIIHFSTESNSRYPSGAPELTLVLLGLVSLYLQFCMACILDHCLSLQTLYCLSFFDSRLLVSPLISSYFNSNLQENGNTLVSIVKLEINIDLCVGLFFRKCIVRKSHLD